MRIQLSDHFSYGRLLRFTVPSIIMMIFVSVYGVVDGLFIANFVGKTPFAAVNFIYPVLDILGTFGYMIGAGGSALIAKTLGEGKRKKANELFSLFVYLSAAGGLIMAAAGIVLIRPLAVMLGAQGAMLEGCVTYGRIILLALPAMILQFEFQTFFVTAEKPKLGLWVTVMAGMINVVLDALFIVVFQWGIVGAAAATALSQYTGGVLPLLYFGRENPSLLRLGKTIFDGKAVRAACMNGSSEFMSSISRSLVGILYNAQLIRYAGENGVAAYGVFMYVSMIFAGIFFGYASGVGPVIGFHYGAQDHGELSSLLRKSLTIIGVGSIGMFAVSEALVYPLSMLFVSYDQQLFQMTLQGFRVFSASFLFAGVAIFGSAFFTALNNGLISALVSFLRTLLFQVTAVIIFPMFWGIKGIWISVVAAEGMAVIVTAIFIFAFRRRYGY